MTFYIRALLTRLGVLTSRPGVFFVIAVYAALWLVFSPETLEWHSVATLATWMMTIFIQRAAHRDTQAIHAKLDHLLDKIEPADGNLAELDRMQPEDIEKFRNETAAPAGETRTLLRLSADDARRAGLVVKPLQPAPAADAVELFGTVEVNKDKHP
jgi:low affinity Fe/Cu permease